MRYPLPPARLKTIPFVAVIPIGIIGDDRVHSWFAHQRSERLTADSQRIDDFAGHVPHLYNRFTKAVGIDAVEFPFRSPQSIVQLVDDDRPAVVGLRSRGGRVDPSRPFGNRRFSGRPIARQDGIARHPKAQAIEPRTGVPRWIRRRKHRHAIAESVQIIAGVAHSRARIQSRIRRVPPARPDVRNRGRAD